MTTCRTEHLTRAGYEAHFFPVISGLEQGYIPSGHFYEVRIASFNKLRNKLLNEDFLQKLGKEFGIRHASQGGAWKETANQLLQNVINGPADCRALITH